VIDGDLFSLPIDVGAIVTPALAVPGLPSTSHAGRKSCDPDTHAPQMIQVVPPDFRAVPMADGTRQLADAYRRRASLWLIGSGLSSVAFPAPFWGQLPRRDGRRAGLWEIAEETLRSTPTGVEVVYLVRSAPVGRARCHG